MAMPRRSVWGVVVVALLGAPAFAEPNAGAGVEIRLDVRTFQLIERESGPVNYYSIVEDPTGNYIHAAYKPPEKTAVLGFSIPDRRRHSIAKIEWKWRAVTLPRDGNECAAGHGDSAAVVYLTWRRALKWYAVKYVWSSVGPQGQVCDSVRNLVRAQDTVIVESGGPLNEWRTFSVDPDAEFRKHFEGSDPKADPPDLMGIGLMSDGDQTKSPSEADYGGFVLTVRP